MNRKARKDKTAFEVSPAADGVWRIVEGVEQSGGVNLEVNIYLVEGRDKALLIDTGFGTADLAGCVRDLTRRSLTVLNTHAHRDHSGGNDMFPEICAHHEEIGALRELSPEPALRPVRGGHTFDLGGRTLEVVEAPGHTKGSIVLIDSVHKQLFAGDTCNVVVWLFLKECLPLEAYLRTLEKLEGRNAEFDVIFAGHGEPLDKSFLDELAVCTRRIVAGECRGEKYETFAGNAMLCTHKRAGVGFDPAKLHLRS
jgi:glyoxylase-like metal-dependent hydrolase (beta-lactamase superfamily II)